MATETCRREIRTSTLLFRIAVVLGLCGAFASLLIAAYLEGRKRFKKKRKEEEEECLGFDVDASLTALLGSDVDAVPESLLGTDVDAVPSWLVGSDGDEVHVHKSPSGDHEVLLPQGSMDSGISDPDQSVPADVESYTSCEDDTLSGTKEPESSTSGSDAGGLRDRGDAVAGAIGESTYSRRHIVTALSDSEFHELLRSPVVEPVMDIRMTNSTNVIHGRQPSSDSKVTVHRYDSALSPSKVDAQVKAMSAMYGDIVTPLQPNTGKIVPGADNVTSRKHRTDEGS